MAATSHDQNFKNLIAAGASASAAAARGPTRATRWPTARSVGLRAEEAPDSDDEVDIVPLRRFRRLSPGAAERLRRASADDLETWADNVLDADTLDDVFRPGN